MSMKKIRLIDGILLLLFTVLLSLGLVLASARDGADEPRPRLEIYIASDHRGYALKSSIVGHMGARFPNVEVHDLGPYKEEPTDYTLMAFNVVNSLAKDRASFGVLICMDGIGMDIAGNYFGFPEKMFSVNCRTVEDAVTAREHNDARILAMGSQLSDACALDMISAFLNTDFLGNVDPIINDRHIKRLRKIHLFADSILKQEAFTAFSASSPKGSEFFRMYHQGLVKSMRTDLLGQFSKSWKRAELLIQPMLDLSIEKGHYACSCSKKISENSSWRPHRDEVGETRVTSFRTAVTLFWSRIVGIQDYDRKCSDQKKARFPSDVAVFQRLFTENIQPFLVRYWEIDVENFSDQAEIDAFFWNLLNDNYSSAIGFLKSSFGSKVFFGNYSNCPQRIQDLERQHLPFIAFLAEEILYPIISYTDHGFLCYAYLNQRHVLNKESNSMLYKAHIDITLAIHRAMILLRLADINMFGQSIPEAKQCSRFIYRTLSLPGGKDCFDPLQLKLSLQHTSYSTHPIGALSVFQTVWCIRLRDEPTLTRTIIIGPSDSRLSLVSGISKHPSEFEAMVPAFSEFIMSNDPNMLSNNHLGWSELVLSFKNLVVSGREGVLLSLFSEIELATEILQDEMEVEDERIWKRRNMRNYTQSVESIYNILSKSASEDGVQLASRFIPEFSLIEKLKTNSYSSGEYEKVLSLFKGLRVTGHDGLSVSFWNELSTQFDSAFATSNELQNLIFKSYGNDKEKYVLEYSMSLCVELWWFGFRFVDEQMQRLNKLFGNPSSMLPKYFYAVVFSFGIIIPMDIYEDFSLNEVLKLSYESEVAEPMGLQRIAEGSTSVIGMDNGNFIWKLFKEFTECPEPHCPCDKRKNVAAAYHEHEISTVIRTNNSEYEQEFVEDHFVEILEAGKGKFSLISNGEIEVPYLKMKYADGITFEKFVTTFFEEYSPDQSTLGLRRFVSAFKGLCVQGLGILKFLKKKQIVQMDFHEGNAIIRQAQNPEAAESDLRLILIDFGLAECYDAKAHEKKMSLLQSKSYMPTIGKGRFPVAKMFMVNEDKEPLPPYVHDLQIFSTRFIENGIFGMSSKLPNIFGRRKDISRHFQCFGTYLSFVKDILNSHMLKEPSFLEEISNAFSRQVRNRADLKKLDEKSSMLINSFSFKLYRNMTFALQILESSNLAEFFESWLKVYFVDDPKKININRLDDFPTPSSLLNALHGRASKPVEVHLLDIIKERVGNFIRTVESTLDGVKDLYGSYLDVEPSALVKIERIKTQLLTIRKREVDNAADRVVRADPFPRAFVSCQGSYNPPTKAHLFLAHEGRERALDIFRAHHPEDSERAECNKSNVFGILSTIATFEVMEKENPQQCFTVEERQGILRSLTGTKTVDFKSGDSPYDRYNDWSWLLLDYSGHSGGAIKNSSQFLAESETIEIVFLIAFAEFDLNENDQFSAFAEDSSVLVISEVMAQKLQVLRDKYSLFNKDIKSASRQLLAGENELLRSKQFEACSQFGPAAIRSQLYISSQHFEYVAKVFSEVLIEETRLENKGNYRLFAVSGEPKNSNNKGLYLGMAQYCPRDLSVGDGSMLSVSSTKVRNYLKEGGNADVLNHVDTVVASRLNELFALFDLVDVIYPKSVYPEQSSRKEQVAGFLNRSYTDSALLLQHAQPVFNHALPLKTTVYRNEYTPLPLTVKKLSLFLQFENSEQFTELPVTLTGVFTFGWNEKDYPFGSLNLSDLLFLDGKRDFIELLDIQEIDNGVPVKYVVFENGIRFGDDFVREALGNSNSFRLMIKARLCPVALNRSGRGLYVSGKKKKEQVILTLMEPFGFSSFFFMQDRPDIQAFYDVILLNYSRPSYLISAGNTVSVDLSEYLGNEHLEGKIPDFYECTSAQIISDRHVKPAYLFQLIFFPFESESSLEESCKMLKSNHSGSTIRILKESKCTIDDLSFAMESLKKTMKFDEDFFGLHYDSENLYLVAATDFNSGAREMRNFMVFSPSKLLANRHISTIDDFYNVERIVAHEYLHHCSGNRVTMRDFFEVALKEGLTVLRDMYFRETAGIFGKCSRIEAVTKLRKTQWVQDSGPKAHSVRPDSIESKNDFEVSLFTTTVYEKGAEILRMLQVMIHEDVQVFARMLSDYFSGPIRHSTVEKLVLSFDLERRWPTWFSYNQFMKWFTVKGTPVVTVDWKKEDNGRWRLELTQLTTNGNDSVAANDMIIPISFGLLSEISKTQVENYEVVSQSGIEVIRDGLIVLLNPQGTITFELSDLHDVIIPTINRGFDASIKVEYKMAYCAHFIAKYESDMMSRFDAFQYLVKDAIYSLYRGEPIESILRHLIDIVTSRLQAVSGSSLSNIWDLFMLTRKISDKQSQQHVLELALSLEEMYLSSLVEDFDTTSFGLVDPAGLSEAREEFQILLGNCMFPDNSEGLALSAMIEELDPFKHPGSVKLEQVILRLYLTSVEVANAVQMYTASPSMERQLALLECRYRLSSDKEKRLRLLAEFDEYIHENAGDHPVAKEKLFKFVILKCSDADELKTAIADFDLLVPTQPQNLKLFAKEFASNNLSVFHSVKGLELMADVISECDISGNHETAATLVKHSFEVNLLKLNDEAQARVFNQLRKMISNDGLSVKLKKALNSLASSDLNTPSRLSTKQLATSNSRSMPRRNSLSDFNSTERVFSM